MRVWIEITFLVRISYYSKFHPLMRVWIEITLIITLPIGTVFHPLMRVWIEIACLYIRSILPFVSPSYEGVD